MFGEYVEHDNAHRPHRSLDQRVPNRLDSTPVAIAKIELAKLRRSDRLCSLIYEYRIGV